MTIINDDNYSQGQAHTALVWGMFPPCLWHSRAVPSSHTAQLIPMLMESCPSTALTQPWEQRNQYILTEECILILH